MEIVDVIEGAEGVLGISGTGFAGFRAQGIAQAVCIAWKRGNASGRAFIKRGQIQDGFYPHLSQVRGGIFTFLVCRMLPAPGE